MPETPPIENFAGLRSFLRAVTEMSFTTLMWAIWIYLFLPLLSLVLWVLGMPYIFRKLFREDVLWQLLALIQRMGWGVLVIFLLLRGWGLYNYYVFGRRERRKQSAEVSVVDIARHFGIQPAEVRRLRQCKETVWTQLYDEMRSNACKLPEQTGTIND